MKPVPIPMKQWLAANERTRVLPGDQWYLNFSASILSLVKQSPLFKEDDYAQKDATVSLTMYFQDVIAQTGGWKTFTELYYKQYNTYLPFYPLSDSYIPDEINPEDIAFVLWTLKSHFALYGPDEYTLQNPYDKDLLALAQEAYKMMDEKFEEAPINEKTSSFLEKIELRLLQPLERLVPDLGKLLDIRVHRFPPQAILFFQRLAQIPADGVGVRRVHGNLGGKLQQQTLAVVLHHQRLIVLLMADGGHGLCCQHDQRPEVCAQHPLQYHGIHVVPSIQLQLDGCEQLPVWPFLEHGRGQTLHGILARRRV